MNEILEQQAIGDKSDALVAHPARMTRLALASLVLGILSALSWMLLLIPGYSLASLGPLGLFFGPFSLIGLAGPILALIFGYVAKGRIGRSGGTLRGRGLAITGIVLGWIVVGAGLLLFIVLAVTWRSGGSWGSLTG